MRDEGDIELKRATWQPWVALGGLVLGFVVSLQAAISGMDGAGSRWFLCAFFLIAIIALGYSIPKMDFSKPLLVITPDGIIYKPEQNGLIPWKWMSAAKIERVGYYRTATQIAIHLRDDVGSALDGVLKDRSGLEGFRNFSELRISANGFSGWSAESIANVVKQRYNEFRAQNPDESDTTPGYSSSAWTGID